MAPQLVGEGQGVQWKVPKALVTILDLWLSMVYDTGYLLSLVSELLRHVLIADKSNLKAWRGACPRYKCITPILVQNLCHQYRM